MRRGVCVPSAPAACPQSEATPGRSPEGVRKFLILAFLVPLSVVAEAQAQRALGQSAHSSRPLTLKLKALSRRSPGRKPRAKAQPRRYGLRLRGIEKPWWGEQNLGRGTVREEAMGGSRAVLWVLLFLGRRIE